MYLLQDALILLLVGAFVVFLLRRWKVPETAGLLIAGALVGPSAINIVNAESMHSLAEPGVVLLLFCVGLEFSISELTKMWRSVVIGGIVQMLITTFLCFILFKFANFEVGTAVLLAALATMSSTALVVALLDERGETTAPHGKVLIGMLLAQDLAIVPLGFMMPQLSKGEMGGWMAPFLLGIGAVVGVLAIARFLVRPTLYRLLRSRQREARGRSIKLFQFVVIAACLGSAYLANLAGLSPALGAFLGGLCIAESEYRHEAASKMLPVRDVLGAVFFMSLGTLLDLSVIAANWKQFSVLVIFVIIIKMFGGFAATVLMNYQTRTCLTVAALIAQVGEFSFVLSKDGLEHGLLTMSEYQLFIAVAAATLFLSPVIDLTVRRYLDRGLTANSSISAPDGHATKKENHVVIVGYGVTGSSVAQSLDNLGIPFVVVEANPDTVQILRRESVEVCFGDAHGEEVLRMAGIQTARAIVIAINDHRSVKPVVRQARAMNEKLLIVARTRFLDDKSELKRLGADIVIAQDEAATFDLLPELLTKLGIGDERIRGILTTLRVSR